MRCERVQTSAGAERAFVFPMPRGKQLAVTVVLLGVACGGGGVIAGSLGILCAALFGLCFLVSLHSLVRPRVHADAPHGQRQPGDGRAPLGGGQGRRDLRADGRGIDGCDARRLGQEPGRRDVDARLLRELGGATPART